MNDCVCKVTAVTIGVGSNSQKKHTQKVWQLEERCFFARGRLGQRRRTTAMAMVMAMVRRRSMVGMSLCGDTAHLHKKVLPKVVLGEFHATVRAPSQPWRKRKPKSRGDCQ